MAYLLTSGKLNNEGSAAKVAVPSVLNMTTEDATALLEQQGFKVEPTFEQRDDVKAGIVFAQRSRPRHQGRQGRARSRSRRARARRRSSCRTSSASSRPMRSPRCRASTCRRTSWRSRPRTSPRARSSHRTRPPVSRCPEQTVVTLQVVGPSDQVEIPDVTGQDQLTAAATLGRNFQVETKQEQSDTVAVGAVISTDPPAGTKVGARQHCHDDRSRRARR